MPSFTVLFEDTSPVLAYSSSWGSGHSETDPKADEWVYLLLSRVIINLNWPLCSGTGTQRAVSHSRRRRAPPWIWRSMGQVFRSWAQCEEITVCTPWPLMGRSQRAWMGLQVQICSIKLYSKIILCKTELILWFWKTSRTTLLISTMWVINSTTRKKQYSSLISATQVTITTQIGNSTEELIVNTFSNTHPSFQYTPESDWYTPNSVSSFSGASGQ